MSVSQDTVDYVFADYDFLYLVMVSFLLDRAVEFAGN